MTDLMADPMADPMAGTAAELARTRVPFVRATVVRAQHPTSSHAGDTALVRADGSIDGFVGGTCAESSVREYGLQVLRAGEPLLLRIVPGGQAAGAEPGAVTVANPCLSGGSMEIFLEPRLPAPRVLVVGDTPIAHALAELGGPLGFAVELTDGAAVPDPDDAALVVASHGRAEEPALTAALRSGVPYVGLVASRTRGACPRRPGPGCTPRPGWTWAVGRRRRSRCRSWPSWSANAGPPLPSGQLRSSR
jgi:xanthine dehydrogenase accessory factor